MKQNKSYFLQQHLEFQSIYPLHHNVETTKAWMFRSLAGWDTAGGLNVFLVSWGGKRVEKKLSQFAVNILFCFEAGFFFCLATFVIFPFLPVFLPQKSGVSIFHASPSPLPDATCFLYRPGVACWELHGSWCNAPVRGYTCPDTSDCTKDGTWSGDNYEILGMIVG